MAIESLSDISKAGSSAFAAGGAIAWKSKIVDFGTVPVYSKTLSFADAEAVIGSKFNFQYAPANDEAEMDQIIVTGACLLNGVVEIYAHAVPGPVTGVRTINYFLG